MKRDRIPRKSVRIATSDLGDTKVETHPKSKSEVAKEVLDELLKKKRRNKLLAVNHSKSVGVKCIIQYMRQTQRPGRIAIKCGVSYGTIKKILDMKIVSNNTLEKILLTITTN